MTINEAAEIAVDICNIDRFEELHNARVKPGFYFYGGSGGGILQEVFTDKFYRTAGIGSALSGDIDIELLLWSHHLIVDEDTHVSS